MTKNQIDYANYKETKRNNEAVLAETNRHNIAGEQFNIANLAETNRHNKAQEGLGYGNLAETSRHNKAQEHIGYGNLAETSRHNVAGERIDLSKLAETQRHNKATESQASAELSEVIRANKARESNLAGQLQKDINSLAETVRHNKNTEMIQNNANDIRADLNRITENYNDEMNRLRFLEWANSSNATDTQVKKQRADIEYMKDQIALQQQNLELAIQTQDWKKANDIATHIVELMTTGLKVRATRAK